MPLVDRYETPGRLRDAPDGSGFYGAWSDLVAGLVWDATRGAGGGELFDATVFDARIAATRSATWMAFPRQLMAVRHRDGRRAAFAAAEQRRYEGEQFEYCEWHTTRDGDGRVTKVVFTTETPEYWALLASYHPNKVLELYREHVHPDVAEEDLFVPGPEDKPVYDPYNHWNTAAGIVHYVTIINTLAAAAGVLEGGVAENGVPDGYHLPPRAPESADDRLARDVGALARRGLSITPADPVGLYIDGWDDTGWTKPDGEPVGDYWTVTRGGPGAVLRLEYEVPAGEGFVVGDIRIGGRPVEFGGQLAEHVAVAARAQAGTRLR
jgi:hypothetical protein